MIQDFIIHIHPTGSNYICYPPVTDTDKDWVALVKPGYTEALMKGGWSTSPTDIQYDSMGNFESWRKKTDNLIVTLDSTFYDKFVHATLIAKDLNLLVKEDRIALFQEMLYAS